MKCFFSLIPFVACAAAPGAWAQDFPAGARVPAAAETSQWLANKVFDVRLANGQSWRLEYKDNGYVWINTSNGFADSGPWRTEDGRLCHALSKVGPSCSDVRLTEAGLFMKRDSVEIVQFIPRK